MDSCIETFKQASHLEWIKNADLAIVFDVGDFKRVREIKSLIKEYDIPVMNIDHHPHPDNHGFSYNIVDIKSNTGNETVQITKILCCKRFSLFAK